jgi:DNA topoisomerase-1
MIIDLGGEDFILRGQYFIDFGWLQFYEPYSRLESYPLPDVKQGESVEVTAIVLEEKQTLPPSRYNPASLLQKMEQGNIGTKATRANIIQTLYDRKYVIGEKMTATNLGLKVTEVLSKFCPSVVSVDFTRQLEEKMNLVQLGKENKQTIINEAIDHLKIVLASIEQNEQSIGQQLNQAINETKIAETAVGKCPKCRDGTLKIQHSKITGKRFVGCNNYFKGTCSTTFPLPQKGFLKGSAKKCSKCGWPTVNVRLKSKRTWNMCLNPSCPGKKQKLAS